MMVCREIKVDHVTVLNNCMEFCTFLRDILVLLNFFLDYNLSFFFLRKCVLQFFFLFFFSKLEREEELCKH